jgi:hypothetical protein
MTAYLLINPVYNDKLLIQEALINNLIADNKELAKENGALKRELEVTNCQKQILTDMNLRLRHQSLSPTLAQRIHRSQYREIESLRTQWKLANHLIGELDEKINYVSRDKVG